MYKNILFISLILLVIFLLYKLYHYYKKQKLISEILEEWKKIPNGGAVDKDTTTIYKGDYYLSISNVENRQSHIHIMTNHRENDLCYLVKKNNLHSKLYFIDKNKTSRELVSEFLQNYNKFNG